ncbi:DUF934 domain-containing protein [Agarilytica rhodophyticola]|uniref:DUF934 domain-containing protein n=1 Tax=Agarilytica rhodophyticola TaxID=1737490 RepID=UPI0013154FC5|nr:DUF934 domain-containing protein [Agarilytica rhodophyticola]
MQKLIKNGELAVNEWHLVEDDSFDLAKLSSGKYILSLARFQDAAKQADINLQNCGVYLNSDDEAESLAANIAKIPLVALNIGSFMDGRSLSQARVVRDQLDFTGEVRAIGNFLQDQLFYLSRCGVNAFLLPEDADIESSIASLSDFSESYQASCDEPQPLFRRRV